jgi:hypothetical protein
MLSSGDEVEGRGASLYLPTRAGGNLLFNAEVSLLGKGHPFLHVASLSIRRGHVAG